MSGVWVGQVTALLAKSLVLWLGILILAVLNGGLRESVLSPALGGVAGQLVSGIILSLCIVLIAWLAIPWLGALSQAEYLYIGVLWLILTVSFEVSFGRFILHQEWAELLDAYRFRGGNIWPIVLACTFIAPWLAARMRGLV